LEDWLNYVRSLSKNSPVILVQNKVDRDNTKSLKNLEDLNQIYTVHDYHRVSAKTNRGIEDLKTLILEAFQQMPEVGLEMPLSWYKIRQELVQLTDSAVKDISYERFEKICDKMMVREISRPSLLRFLHDTGILFYQKKMFNNRIILDQKWAINAIYTLFDRKGIFYDFKRKDGIFTLDNLKWAWPESSLEEQEVFLSVMVSCELCFQLNWDLKNPIYIAPQLLPSKKPEYIELNWKNKQGKCLHLIYRHQFLHSAIIQRFIVRAGPLTKASQMWKNGISFHYQSSEALIEVIEVDSKIIDLQNKPSAEVISIQIFGSDNRELLQRIRNEFERIHHFEAAPVEWISVNGIDFIAFEEFKKYWNNSEVQILIAPSGNKVELQDLMEFLPHEEREQRPGAEKPGIRELPSLKEQQTMTKQKAINIFISYSHKDEEFKDELVDIWLKPLKRNINFEYWDDRKILAGQEWEPAILEKLNSADVIILLLSQPFLASDFCTDIEMNRALERRQAEGILVLPILIRECNWEDSHIAKLQIVPRDCKPLNTLPDRDTAWKTVVQEIKKALAARAIG
jgi:internalin A